MNLYKNESFLKYDPYDYIQSLYGARDCKEKQPIPRLDLFPIDEGYFKGTIYRNLYKPYKHFQPRRIIPTTEKEKMLLDVDKYHFGLHEIRIHLDNHPNDKEAIEVFTQFQKAYIAAKHAYENKFGAIDIEGPHLDTAPWMWTMGTWPWDEGM